MWDQEGRGRELDWTGCGRAWNPKMPCLTRKGKSGPDVGPGSGPTGTQFSRWSGQLHW